MNALFTALRNLPRRERLWLVYAVILAILLRLLFVLVLDPSPATGGGDIGFYLEMGPKLVRNISPPLPTAPVFLVYVGLVQALFNLDPTSLLLTIRVLNIAWHVLLIVAVFVLGKRYFNGSVGAVAALIIAVNPFFIIETGQAATESLFVGVLFCGLALYAVNQDRPTASSLIITGLLLGLATLTRAVVLFFPL